MKAQYRKEAIAARLLATRTALGYGEDQQERFAQRAKIRQNTYSQYESCTNRLNIDQAIKLCGTYKLTLDWIYRGDPSGLRSKLHRKLADMGAIPEETLEEDDDDDVAEEPPAATPKRPSQRRRIRTAVG